MNPVHTRGDDIPTRRVFLNGAFIPEPEASVSVFDRSFLYGDGLFETLRVACGIPLLWDAHLSRLTRGAARLQLSFPTPPDDLLPALAHLLELNGLRDAVVRIHVSRGRGPRGYSPRGAHHPVLVMATFPAAAFDSEPLAAWRLHTSRLRLPCDDPVVSLKSANRLLHVLARAEAEDAGADEALLLDSAGHLAELASANLFWLRENTVHTPALATGALPGVTRAFLLDLLPARGWRCAEVTETPSALHDAEAAFASLSTAGIVVLDSLDGRPLGRDVRVAAIRNAYQEAMRRFLSH